MPRYIVDASIVAKWILPGEPYENKAARLKEDTINVIAELHSPSMLMYEVANILWRASKMHRISRKDAIEALKALSSMKITLYDLRWEDMTEGFGLSTELDLTIYDVAYILLSLRLSMPLITADDQLLERAKDRSKLIHIRDY